MKNLKLLHLKIFSSVLILFSVVIFSSCQSKQKEANSINQDDINAMKDAHLISLDSAVNMYHRYEELRLRFTKDSLTERYGADFKDTRNVWFNIKTIKAYIEHIEKNAGDAEGLAFYFGVNSSNARQGKNHQSFFIAPTVKNGDHQSGFTIKDGKRVFLYKAFKEIELGSLQKGGFFSLPPDDEGLLLNEGKDSPPGGVD